MEKKSLTSTVLSIASVKVECTKAQPCETSISRYIDISSGPTVAAVRFFTTWTHDLMIINTRSY
jgi:hypothetical protein